MQMIDENNHVWHQSAACAKDAGGGADRAQGSSAAYLLDHWAGGLYSGDCFMISTSFFADCGRTLMGL